jgi:hypothetical protein
MSVIVYVCATAETPNTRTSSRERMMYLMGIRLSTRGQVGGCTLKLFGIFSHVPKGIGL